MNRLAFFLCLLAIVSPCEAQSNKTPAQTEMSQLATACTQYKTEYGAFPSGKSAEIILALTGTNPRKFTFIQPAAASGEADDRLRDEWGTPYRIQFPDAGTIEIRSAGPDTKFDTADDKQLRKDAQGVERYN
jgi:hypothetical protein